MDTQGMYCQTPSLTLMLMPPNPQHKGSIPHITCRYPLKHTDAQGIKPMSVRQDMGRHPPYGGRCPTCKGGVQHVRGPYNPHNMQMPLITHRCNEYGGHIGVSEPLEGLQTPGGVQMYRVYEHRECLDIPQV